jgi:hypothetical protein
MNRFLIALTLGSLVYGGAALQASADDGCVDVRGYTKNDGATVNGYARNAPGGNGCRPGPDEGSRMSRGGGYDGARREMDGVLLMPLGQEYPAPNFDGREIRGSRSLHHDFGSNPCVMIPRNFPSWQYDRNLVRFMKGACPGFENIQVLGQ